MNGGMEYEAGDAQKMETMYVIPQCFMIIAFLKCNFL